MTRHKHHRSAVTLLAGAAAILTITPTQVASEAQLNQAIPASPVVSRLAASPVIAGATGKLDVTSISPAPGSTVNAVPSAIVVTFGAKPAVAIIEAKVNNQAIRIPPPVISGNTATGKIPAGSPQGVYTVVIAGSTQDRKVAKQQFTFTVAAAKPDDKPKPTTTKPADKPTTSKPDDTTKPTPTKPGTTKPGAAKPGTNQPTDGSNPTTKPGQQPDQTSGQPTITPLPTGGPTPQPGQDTPATPEPGEVPQRPSVPTPIRILMGVLAVAFLGLLWMSWRHQYQPRKRGPQYDHTPLDQQGRQAP